MSALIVCMQTMQNTQKLEWKDRLEVLALPCSFCVLLRESWTFLSSDLPSENWESEFSLLWVVLQIKWDDVLRKSSENLKAPNRSFIHICYHCSLFFFFWVFCIKTSCQMWEQNYSKTLRLNQNWQITTEISIAAAPWTIYSACFHALNRISSQTRKFLWCNLYFTGVAVQAQRG